MKNVLIVVLLFILSSMSGCISNGRASNNSWTVMVYMAGDNSLSSVVDSNLKEIMNVGSSGNLKIIVLSDKDGEGDSHLYYVKPHQLKEYPIGNIWLKRPNEIYTGRCETLQSFLDWTMKNFGAKHYMLVIWGHGNGWRGAAEDKGDPLNLTEMKNALGDRKIDIIGFDACYMGSIEVNYELKDNADYLVASEKKLPRAGWPYEMILGNMSGRSPRDVGKMIVSKYVNSYSAGKRDNEGFSIEIALIKLKTGLEDDFKTLLDNHPDLKLYPPCRFESDDVADLGMLVNDTNITRILSKTVVSIQEWNNPKSTMTVNGASGLAIYYPGGQFDEEYRTTSFAEFSGWDRLIC